MAGQAAGSLDEDWVELTEEDVKALEAPYRGEDDDGGLVVKPAEVEKPAAKVAASKQAERKPEGEPDVVVSLKARLEAATRAAEEEKQRRIEAERRANENAAKAREADVHVVENQVSAVANAIEKAKADGAAAKAAHVAALEAGDYAKAADAAEAMATIKARLAQLEDGRAALDERVTVVREAAKKPVEIPVEDKAPADPVERYISQFGPREQEWLRKHTECVTDDELNAKVLWADKAAKKKGIKPGTDDYFAFLDKEMGYAAAESEGGSEDGGEDEVVVETAAPKPKAAPAPTKRVAAPVSRSEPFQRGDDGKYRVRLTAEQREMAEAMGISPTAYAKQLLALKQQEKNPGYSGPRLGIHN